ncbi:hypothetical protein LOD99_9700 [Oopsacas minuta]|uniref:Uncharacterized protein n=1 Tax=Oopsacas minuta TaxID=111878 RepID=A0AAV7KMZ9_9METZ|nr:hypothetical protein LOD99_9700 [Oopsacas minuta]
MATNFSGNYYTLSLLDSYVEMEQNICRTFDKIIRTASDRRNELIAQLNDMKITFLNKEVVRENRLLELENSLQRILKSNARQIEIIQLQNREISRIREQQEIYSKPTPFPVPILLTEGFQTLLQEIEGFGHVQGTAGPYINKKTHFNTFGRKGEGKGEMNDPKGIVIDSARRLFVADFLNKRVQVFSQDGNFIADFGSQVFFRPYGIALFDEFVFVTDRQLNLVFKFLQTNYNLVGKSVKGNLNSPSGLTIDRDREVLVADRSNNRIAVFSSELKFVREFGEDKLDYPQDVKINLNKIYVADNNEFKNIHIFSKTGDLLKSVIQLANVTRNIFICFDSNNNILISDSVGDTIQIFTPDGRMVHRIKSLPNPAGIAVTQNFHIICARHYLYTCDIRFY